MDTVRLSTIKEVAAEEGLSVVSVTSAEPLLDDAQAFLAWQKHGHAAEMSYMEREPELLSDPRRLLPSARSVVVFGASYDQGRVDECPSGYGRVARYAWGKDYHRIVKARVLRVLERIGKEIPRDISARVFTDSAPILERALARRAQLGFVGKNTLLIMPGFGSFLFLAEILWDLEVDIDVNHAESQASCGTCSRCVALCPTNAFTSPYVLDAGRCISYLTIEKRTPLTRQERVWLGEWVFGCDVCQEVCPFNYTSIKRRGKALIPLLQAENGVGPLLSLADILAIRDSTSFVARFGGTALMRAKREGLLRNAAVVVANTGAVQLASLIEDTALGDPSPSVRQHALWAAASLAEREGEGARARVRGIAERFVDDESTELAEEARTILC